MTLDGLAFGLAMSGLYPQSGPVQASWTNGWITGNAAQDTLQQASKPPPSSVSTQSQTPPRHPPQSSLQKTIQDNLPHIISALILQHTAAHPTKNTHQPALLNDHLNIPSPA